MNNNNKGQGRAPLAEAQTQNFFPILDKLTGIKLYLSFFLLERWIWIETKRKSV